MFFMKTSPMMVFGRMPMTGSAARVEPAGKPTASAVKARVSKIFCLFLESTDRGIIAPTVAAGGGRFELFSFILFWGLICEFVGRTTYKAFTKDASRVITDYFRNDMHSKGKIANIFRSGT